MAFRSLASIPTKQPVVLQKKKKDVKLKHFLHADVLFLQQCGYHADLMERPAWRLLKKMFGFTALS